MFLAQFRHDGLEKVLVVLVSSPSFHQHVQLCNQLVFDVLEISLDERKLIKEFL